MSRGLDLASTMQAAKDLYENRNTKNRWLLLNNIGQLLSATSAFMSHSGAPSLNLLAATTAYHKVRDDYQKGRQIDIGDLITLGGNLAGVAINLYEGGTKLPVPPQLKFASIAIAVAGLAYSNREYLGEKLRRISNGDFEMKEIIQDAKDSMNELLTSENSQPQNQPFKFAKTNAEENISHLASIGINDPADNQQANNVMQFFTEYTNTEQYKNFEIAENKHEAVILGQIQKEQVAENEKQALLNSDYYTKPNQFGLTQAFLDEANRQSQEALLMTKGRSV